MALKQFSELNNKAKPLWSPLDAPPICEIASTVDDPDDVEAYEEGKILKVQFQFIKYWKIIPKKNNSDFTVQKSKILSTIFKLSVRIDSYKHLA